ncbi:MAG: hypothetical protein ABEJ56_03380, partial [Candidatus Nanohaloarchaea archaeon]
MVVVQVVRQNRLVRWEALRKLILLAVLTLILTTLGSSYSIGTEGSWGMVSIPEGKLSVSDLKSSCIVLDGPYTFSARKGDYVKTAYMHANKGYWLRTDGQCEVNIQTESKISDITFQAGWNIVSTVRSNPIPRQKIRDKCGLEKDIWSWNPSQARYVSASEISSFKGYWVKVNRFCTISLDSEDGNGDVSDRKVFYRLKGSPGDKEFVVDP